MNGKWSVRFWLVAGMLFVPAIWWVLTEWFCVSERYLPSIQSVATAWVGLEPSILVHLSATAFRFVIGFLIGTLAGITLSVITARMRWLDALLTPTILSMRAIPAAAMVPFFLLWFGFSESGRYVLATVAVAFNVSVAARQILAHIPMRHDSFFKSYGLNPYALTFKYCLPRIAEGILPTLRYSLALAIGAIAVSELLGSQVGLGYLLQTARSTFSLNLLFLSMLLFGVLSIAADSCLKLGWRYVTFWTKNK